MNDIENEGGPETRSRKRRSSGGSALTDISNIGTNFLQQSFSYVGKKFGGTKKRRTSVSYYIAVFEVYHVNSVILFVHFSNFTG